MKSRALSKGPWKLREVFGLKGRVGKKIVDVEPADLTAPAARMLDHVMNFGSACERVAFVTNGVVDAGFQEAINSWQAASGQDVLMSNASSHFGELALAYAQSFPGLTIEQFFKFVRTFHVEPEAGVVSELRTNLLVLADRMIGLSEVELTHGEAGTIADSVVDLVRAKSHATIDAFPIDEVTLRNKKAVTQGELLRLLSLSAEGYEELRRSGKNALVALSRLHRLCKRSGVPDAMIPNLCRLKAEWDVWYLDNRHQVPEIDAATLRGEAHVLLHAHARGQLPFDKLRAAAADVAKRLGRSMPTGVQLSDAIVVGLVFALAAETGAAP